ncbi:MAG TPA: hypothetical protein VFV37_07865 [Luteibaculaceae bacterium]|nr:hypothetical protein [Luteibaculaceae bacterium]
MSPRWGSMQKPEHLCYYDAAPTNPVSPQKGALPHGVHLFTLRQPDLGRLGHRASISSATDLDKLSHRASISSATDIDKLSHRPRQARPPTSISSATDIDKLSHRPR